MKRRTSILLAALLLLPALIAAREDVPDRKKVAVVLSGGGAKGVAHIGALRIIEDAGIPIDMIVGTSMGSIIGGLYAIGYTPDQLDSMVMAQDWGQLLSDRTERRYQTYEQRENDDKYLISFPFGKKIEGVGGLIKGTNLETLFNDLMIGYHDSVNFNTLPIPFACVAADIVTGETVVFHEGILPVAMRASMAIPGAFTPVYTGDMVLVDGGITNNYPTDVAMEMGADIIIGVDVSSSLRDKDELVGAGAIIGQIIDLVMQRQTYHRNISLTDVYMKVDVEGYSSASFNLPALDSLMRRGEFAAEQKWEDLVELKERIGIDDTFVIPAHGPFTCLNQKGFFHVYDISFDGLDEKQSKWVMRKSRINDDSDMDITALNRCMSILNATSSYSDIYYSLCDTLDGYNLRFHMEEARGNSINLGLNFDSEEIASIMVNTVYKLGKKVPMEASATARFGQRIMGQVDYAFLPTPLTRFNFNYTFNHNDIKINERGNRAFNATYNHHLGSFSFSDMNFLRQNFKLEVGLRYERFFFHNILIMPGEIEPLLGQDSEHFVSYYALFDYKTLDSRYFAQRGSAVSISYQLFTDNFVQYRDHSPFTALSFSWMTAIPLTRRFSLLPGVYGRIINGSDIPFQFSNMIGGMYFGRYLPQQMPFHGVAYMETTSHLFLAAKVQARQRIGKRHYVTGTFNYGLANDGWSTLLSEGDNYFGASLDYGYNMRFLPIIASLSWSNITKSVGFYIQAGYMF